MSEGRPSPEALLAAARGEGRGRLKLFIGAAPGVGKTFEMLQTAQAKRREGVDVFDSATDFSPFAGERRSR